MDLASSFGWWGATTSPGRWPSWSRWRFRGGSSTGASARHCSPSAALLNLFALFFVLKWPPQPGRHRAGPSRAPGYQAHSHSLRLARELRCSLDDGRQLYSSCSCSRRSCRACSAATISRSGTRRSPRRYSTSCASVRSPADARASTPLADAVPGRSRSPAAGPPARLFHGVDRLEHSRPCSQERRIAWRGGGRRLLRLTLYYALLVKNASVDAGGAHGELIGLGFRATGPLRWTRMGQALTFGGGGSGAARLDTVAALCLIGAFRQLWTLKARANLRRTRQVSHISRIRRMPENARDKFSSPWFVGRLVWRLGLALCLFACSSTESRPVTGRKLGSTRQPIVGGVPDTTSKGVVAITDLLRRRRRRVL